MTFKPFINVFILIKEIERNIFFARGVPGGRGKFIFSLLLEIGPLNIIFNVAILIKEIERNIFFARGVNWGGAKFVFLYYYR